MKFSGYVTLWVGITALMIYENYLLNQSPANSFSAEIQKTFFPNSPFNLSPQAGRPISLFLGWSGFGFILLTNFYILRKRLGFLRIGKLPGWLNFHIFCGLIGPTLIVFHTNFKVRGLVSISFWSMIIVAASGIIGRYFYIQLGKKKHEIEGDARYWDDRFTSLVKQLPLQIPEQNIVATKRAALQMVGGSALARYQSMGQGSVLGALLASLVGDVRMMFALPKSIAGLPGNSKLILKEYALTTRKVFFYDFFQQLLGYWHSFHLPFAVFMYLVAVIHIATALLFGVKG